MRAAILAFSDKPGMITITHNLVRGGDRESSAPSALSKDLGIMPISLLAFFSQLKSKVGNILAKATALRINLYIDGAPIGSRAHTHPSHSQTSRLLFTPSN
jgi:hypothetical protein